MDLVDELAGVLRRGGHVSREIPDEEIAAQWRAAARQAGRTVQTYRVGDTTGASLTDWPANELERQVILARMRNAINRISG